MADIVHHVVLYAPPEGLTIREVLLRVRPPHLDVALQGPARFPGALSLNTVIPVGSTYSHRYYDDPHRLGRPTPGVEVHLWKIAILPLTVDTTPDGIDPTFKWTPSKVDS